MGAFIRDTALANPNTSNWDVGNIRSFGESFLNALSAIVDVSGFDMRSATNCTLMFKNSPTNANTANWQIPLVTNFAGIFDNSGLTTDNYDIFLNMASGQTVQSGIVLGASGVNYTTAGAGAAHTDLVDNDLWVITDAGGI
jgi:hypothetical protein